MKLIDKEILLLKIDSKIEEAQKVFNVAPSSVTGGMIEGYERTKKIINTLEVKEVDLELIIGWFEHIAQIADDRKTLNGAVMEDWAALDEIKCLARNSAEFMKIHYKAQKGE